MWKRSEQREENREQSSLALSHRERALLVPGLPPGNLIFRRSRVQHNSSPEDWQNGRSGGSTQHRPPDAQQHILQAALANGASLGISAFIAEGGDIYILKISQFHQLVGDWEELNIVRM
jgi:hypothetical protein